MKTTEDIEQALIDLNIDVISTDNNIIKFWHKNSTVIYYVKKQWATGKSINDGRGFENLLKQLK